jgi:hypothetical protein
LHRAVVEQATDLGVDADTCTLVVDRSTVRHNQGGGMSLTFSHYEITNSFVVDNGGASSAVGGIRLAGMLGAGAVSLSFSTIANNRPSGIECATTPAAPALGSSIVWNNPSSGCTFASSDVQGGPMDADPQFKDAAGGDYHLLATSPCRDTGENLGAPSFDFDGDPRPTPVGGHVDIGADELTP